MKKLMIAALLLWSTATVYAGTPKSEEATGKNPKAKNLLRNTGMCNFTMSAMVGPSGNQIEIKCTYSSPACWIAIVQVMMCLEDAKREFIQ
ncbi:MAG: hypothetical protein WBP58_08735 [Chitinophagaceae bacterium]